MGKETTENVCVLRINFISHANGSMCSVIIEPQWIGRRQLLDGSPLRASLVAHLSVTP